jgi:hypothetical protein
MLLYIEIFARKSIPFHLWWHVRVQILNYFPDFRWNFMVKFLQK